MLALWFPDQATDPGDEHKHGDKNSAEEGIGG